MPVNVGVDFSGPQVVSARAQRVYVRQYWSYYSDPTDPTSDLEDVPWTLQPDIHCEDVTWSLLPTIPSASLVMPYGQILPYYDPLGRVRQVGPLDLRGWYVKIEFDVTPVNLVAQDNTGTPLVDNNGNPVVESEAGTLSWYGFIDEVVYERGGSQHVLQRLRNGSNTASIWQSGVQRFVAYGIEQVWAHWFMDKNWWFRQQGTDLSAANTIHQNRAAIPFNMDGKPNRTGTDINGDKPINPSTGQQIPVHIFQAATPYNSHEPDPQSGSKVPAYWSSRDIARYLAAYQAPQDKWGNTRIPFAIFGADKIPNWDKPTIETEGVPILDILNRIVNPSRMLAMSTRVNEADTPNTVELVVHSLTADDLQLPINDPDSLGVAVHPGADRLVTIAADKAPDVHVTVQQSTTSIVNRVRVRGGRMRTTFETNIGDPQVDDALLNSWRDADETAYEEGASNQASYSGLTSDQQRQANKAVRDAMKYRDVFQTFCLYQTWRWDEDVQDQQGFPVKLEVFPQDRLNPNLPYYPFWGMVQLVELPFKEKWDYSEEPTFTDEESFVANYRDPLILMDVPGAQPPKYAVGDKLADGVITRIAVGAGVAESRQALQLRVAGGEQYQIAKTDHTALPVDELVDHDFYDSLVVITVEEDRFVEGIWPREDILITGNPDIVREKLFYAGEEYREWRCMPNVTVDVDDEGQAKALNDFYLSDYQGSTWQPKFYFKDDQKALQSLAQIAALWWTVPRSVMRLQCARATYLLNVGDYVVSVDGFSVGSTISQINYSHPLGNGQNSPAAFSVVTALGERDPLQFAPSGNYQTVPASSAQVSRGGRGGGQNIAQQIINNHVRQVLSRGIIR